MIPPQRSGPLTPLLLRMMAPEPADRPTMSEVSRTLIPSRDRRRAPAPAATGAGGPTTRCGAGRLGADGAGLPVRPAGRNAEPRPRGAPARRHAEPGPRSDRSRRPPAPGRTPHRDSPHAAPSALAADDPTSHRRLGDVDAAAGVGRAHRRAVVLAAALTAGFLAAQRRRRRSGLGRRHLGAEPGRQRRSPVPEVRRPSSDLGQRVADRRKRRPPAAGAPDPAGRTRRRGQRLLRADARQHRRGLGAVDAGSFQSGIAQNRDYYNSFWGGVQRVVATDVIGTAPGTVEATITYYLHRRHACRWSAPQYQLVRDGDDLKIDNSTVLSSRSG